MRRALAVVALVVLALALLALLATGTSASDLAAGPFDWPLGGAAVPAAELRDATLLARPMLVSAFGATVVTLREARVVRLADGTAQYPTVTAAGDVALSPEPDPLTGAQELAWTLVSPTLVFCVARGALRPAFAAYARGARGYAYATALGGGVAYAPAPRTTDAFLWLVAADATGAVLDASDARAVARAFAGIQPYTPVAHAEPTVQPELTAGARFGTHVALPQCGSALYAPKTCTAADTAGKCTLCNFASQELCAAVARHGACDAPLGSALCARTCCMYSCGAAGAWLVPTAPLTARALRMTVEPMLDAAEAEPARASAAADATFDELRAVLATGRWAFGSARNDPAVNGLNAVVRAWNVWRRTYFWAVLRAMAERRVDGGACWTSDSPVALSDRQGAEPARTDCRAYCYGDGGDRRYLNYHSVLDLACDDALEVSVAAAVARLTAAGTPVSPAEVAAARPAGLGDASSARFWALLTRDYEQLGWAGLAAMFQLDGDELGVLRAAVAGARGVPRASRAQWERLDPLRRVRLLDAWNEGAVFSFGARAVALPRGTGAPAANAASHFPFQHAFWPTDRLTATGATVVGGGARACMRCGAAAPGATSAVATMAVTCPRIGTKPSRPLTSDAGGWVGTPDGDAFEPPVAQYGPTYDPKADPTDVGSYVERDGGAVVYARGAYLGAGLVETADTVEAKPHVPLCAAAPVTLGGATFDSSANDGVGVWAARAPYATQPPPPMAFNPFAARDAYGAPTVVFNDAFEAVTVPPGFAAYVTAHYHGYHASAASCHTGVPRLAGVTPGAAAAPGLVVRHDNTPLFTNRVQCAVSSWMPQHPAPPERPSLECAATVRGVLLINDDLASAWTVRKGESVATADEPPRLDPCKSDPYATRVAAVPAHANCVAAWNYFAYPTHWLQRGHVDPASGDLPPACDAVAAPAHHNVRTPRPSLAELVAYNRDALNVTTVLRSGRSVLSA